MDFPPVVANFVPKVEGDSIISDALASLTTFIVLEKQKSWKQGFEAAQAIALYEEELSQ